MRVTFKVSYEELDEYDKNNPYAYSGVFLVLSTAGFKPCVLMPEWGDSGGLGRGVADWIEREYKLKSVCKRISEKSISMEVQ